MHLRLQASILDPQWDNSYIFRNWENFPEGGKTGEVVFPRGKMKEAGPSSSCREYCSVVQKEQRHLRLTRALEPASDGLSVEGYVCLFFPGGPYYLTKVPGLFLNAVSCAQVDKAVLAQYILSALSLVLQKYSIICQEAGEVEGLRVLGLSFMPWPLPC